MATTTQKETQEAACCLGDPLSKCHSGMAIIVGYVSMVMHVTGQRAQQEIRKKTQE